EGAPGLGPVLDEGRGQAVDRWPFHPEVRVSPLFVVAGVTVPLLGNPHSAGEPDGFVDNAHLAMTAMVLLEGRIQPELAVPVHIDTRVLHSLDDPVLDLDTTEGVDEDPHPQPCPGPLTQRVCELLSGPALPVHKGHEVDSVLCLSDRFEHGREDLVAVAEDRDRVAFSEVDSDQALQGTTQLPPGVLARLRCRAVVQQGRQAPPGPRTSPCTLDILGSKVPRPRANDRTADPGVTRSIHGVRAADSCSRPSRPTPVRHGRDSGDASAGGLPGPFLRSYASVKGDGAGRGGEASAHQLDYVSGEIVSGRPPRVPGGARQGRPTGMTNRRAECGALDRLVD